MLRIRTKPHPKRPGVFIASFEGRTLCISRTPMADGARALLRMGFHPTILVTMRHEGSAHDSFVPETLANWAARAYVETPSGPKIVPFRPFPSDRTDDSGENSESRATPQEKPQ